MADWFEQPEAEVLAGLDSGRQGIDSGEAQQRLKIFCASTRTRENRLKARCTRSIRLRPITETASIGRNRRRAG